MSGEPTLRARLERQRYLITVLAQEIRREHGPTIADPIAGALNSMSATTVAALALLDETSAYAAGTYDVVFTEEGDRYPTRFRLVPDPVVSSIATRDP